MARIVWTTRAVDDLERIERYIARQRPLAATRLVAHIIQATLLLRTFPMSGRAIGGRRRELTLVRPYLIRFRVEGDLVKITNVRHGARRPD